MNSTKALLAGLVSAALVLGNAPSAGANGRTDPCYDKPCPVDVLSVTDGDTVVLAGYGSVRLIGIDSPEMDECGGPEAKSNLESIVSQGGVGIWADTNQPDRDRYDRLLRHLTFSGGALAGEQQLLDNHAEARYDSRDGYGTHDAEDIYRSISTSPPKCTVPPRPSDDEAAVAEGNADRCNYFTYRAVKSWSKKTQRRAAYGYYKRYGRARGFSNWKAFKAACIYPETLMWIRAGIVNRKGRVVGYRDAVVEHIPASIGGGGSSYNGPRYYAPGGSSYTGPRYYAPGGRTYTTSPRR